MYFKSMQESNFLRSHQSSLDWLGLVWLGLVGKSGNVGIRPIVASACLSPLGGDFALPLL